MLDRSAPTATSSPPSSPNGALPRGDREPTPRRRVRPRHDRHPHQHHPPQARRRHHRRTRPRPQLAQLFHDRQTLDNNGLRPNWATGQAHTTTSSPPTPRSATRLPDRDHQANPADPHLPPPSLKPSPPHRPAAAHRRRHMAHPQTHRRPHLGQTRTRHHRRNPPPTHSQSGSSPDPPPPSPSHSTTSTSTRPKRHNQTTGHQIELAARPSAPRTRTPSHRWHYVKRAPLSSFTRGRATRPARQNMPVGSRAPLVRIRGAIT